MDLDELEAFERSEREHAKSHGRKGVRSGVVRDLRKAFDDLKLPDFHGAHRPGAPLHLLVFLYPATVVFVPPTSRELLEQRFGMSLDDFVGLQERGIIQPLIGHPIDYADKPHLDPILSRRPPSVWARGDQVAHSFAHGAEFWDDARELLPLREITRVKWVREKWQRQYPTLSGRDLSRQIEIEICTNYVDLCIFGWEQLAKWVLETRDPSWIAGRLIELNEVTTYPQLLGLGGTPNYGVKQARLVEQVRSELLLQLKTREVGPEAAILLSGLELQFPTTVSADAVLSFHREGLSERLWRALDALESEIGKAQQDSDDILLDKSVTANRIVKEAVREAKGLALDAGRGHRQNEVLFGMKAASIGSIAGLGMSLGLEPFASVLAGLAGTEGAFRAPIVGKRLEAVEMKITDWLLARKFRPTATELWWIAKWSSQR